MVYDKIKRVLVGCPLETKRERHERLNIPLALAVFASDALSSTAYATEEILVALVASALAAQANLLSLPVAGAIVLLMFIVVMSYRQVIRAYPQGGGAYIVAKESLGTSASLVVGAALTIDYVLTVAVSVSAGIAAIISTGLISPRVKVPLAVLFVIVMTLINLRGVKESGKVIAFPAYTFIIVMFILIGYGGWRIVNGDYPAEVLETTQASLQQLDIFDSLVMLTFLNAFAHGCAALTGIEAISDGVKAFKQPVATNGGKTMLIMGTILATMFIGITLLAYYFHITPMECVPNQHCETVVSQIARAVFGSDTLFYYFVQFATMIILVMAANTSYAGFPRLAHILADDGFLPRQLMNMGDRLVFSNGIMVLGVASSFLILAYHANTHDLIPLYAVGVFLSFTLAQAGMVQKHKKDQEQGWKRGLLINGLGAIVTGMVTILLTVEKFTEGAWIVIVAIPALMLIFRSIKNHYRSIGKQLALPESGYCPVPIEHTVLVLVSSLNKGTIPALEYAKTISQRVEAVHVELNAEATTRLRKAWDEWGCGIPLTILKSPYRSITQPILDYVDEVESRYEHDLVTIIVPEFVTKKFWHNLLHNQTSLLIKTLLRMRKGKVVTTIRYYLEE